MKVDYWKLNQIVALTTAANPENVFLLQEIIITWYVLIDLENLSLKEIYV